MNEFRFYIPIKNVNQELEFAIEFKMSSETIWANNENRNFKQTIKQVGLLKLYHLATDSQGPDLLEFVIDQVTDKMKFVKEQITTLLEDITRQSQKIQSRLYLSKISLSTAIAKFQEKQIHILHIMQSGADQ
ncbi:CBM21_domain superfamily [Hexamita inflata]|uniref:CBM21 domain superfamily n=1 Tax=Hexamita inflata TaxID=28002 RepID=A0AA86TWT8_9EUKA|nr:CBM21 domain superfamily [Hexamita inflata]CAI9944659.1 CBM21 domain superfamily [Hexamita inflata]